MNPFIIYTIVYAVIAIICIVCLSVSDAKLCGRFTIEDLLSDAILGFCWPLLLIFCVGDIIDKLDSIFSQIGQITLWKRKDPK